METLVGAAVGVLVNVLFPPAVQTRHAGQAVQRLAEEIAALLEEAAQGLGSPSAGSSAGSVTDSGNLFPTGTGWFTIPSVDRSSGDHGLTPTPPHAGSTTPAGSAATSHGSTAR